MNKPLVTPAPAILTSDAVWNGKCRPIPYSTPMIKVKRDGIKDMTRRTRGLNKINKNPDDWELYLVFPGDAHTLPLWNFRKKNDHSIIEIIKCPYGIVGDRLWVRETYSVPEPEEDTGLMDDKGNSLQGIAYKADTKNELINEYKWKPSMFMPRWASRMTDETILIRCERLQDITPEDCLREGVFIEPPSGADPKRPDNWLGMNGIERKQYLDNIIRPIYMARLEYCDMLVKAYMDLWDSINGKKLPSTINPWLWVIGTKPIDYGKEEKK